MEFKTYKKEGMRLKIVTDESPESPREWDNNGIMVCFHRRYNLPNEAKLSKDDYSSWEELETYIKGELKALVVLPIFMYDHSGVTLSTQPFSCQWDSGQIGFIFTTEEHLRKRGHDKIPSIEELTKWLEQEVKTYSQFLEGDVYGFQLVKISVCSHGDEHEEETDSCYGYFGTDFKENGLFEAAGIEDISEWEEE